MKDYNVLVMVEQIAGDIELDWDDTHDNPSGEYEYEVEADSEYDAFEAALDIFHMEVPISCLDHFEVTPTVTFY